MDRTLPNSPAADSRASAAAAGFFRAMGRLSPLRVISQWGPSTFEAIVDSGPHDFDRGFMNPITPAYHGHLETDAFGHVRSQDTIHGRSGRRVPFLELRERADSSPFLQVYLYRGKNEDFDEERLELLERLHTYYADGVTPELLAANPETDP